MDTLTQAVLGASIGAAVAGHGERRRGAVWGAACGTLPDLDVLVPLGDPVSDFTWHRGYSHSLFVLSVAAPAIWWLISRLDSRARQRPRRWLALVWLALFTHPLLDAFTVYGTQLFLPFSDHPVSGSTVFIIDPAFTVPLAVGLGVALIVREEHRARAAVVGGLTLAVAYLGLSVAAKLHVERVARDALADAGIAHGGVLTTPAPFNIVLWRIVAMEEGGYREGFYSLLDPPGTLSFERHESRPELLDGIRDAWAVRRLAWFTHGFYRVSRQDDRIVMTDLRMGVEPVYVFSFAVGRLEGGGARAVEPQQLTPLRPGPGQVARLLRRVAGPVASAEDSRTIPGS
ncbi:metal-dependent hydrolase [Lentisalinibacter salinarum]|uniref:metal-dependent hydrolase n=1 Tax=Lentisalinibacter salinarum TaxID=2992239 RepID=UPI0038684CDC